MGFSADDGAALVAVVVGDAVRGSVVDEQLASRIAMLAATKTVRIGDINPARPAQISV